MIIDVRNQYYVLSVLRGAKNPYQKIVPVQPNWNWDVLRMKNRRIISKFWVIKPIFIAQSKDLPKAEMNKINLSTRLSHQFHSSSKNHIQIGQKIKKKLGQVEGKIQIKTYATFKNDIWTNQVL